MTTTRKVLAQASPTVTTEVVVYTCGAVLGAVISTAHICNLTTGAVTVTINIGVAGAASSNANTIAKTVSIPANGFLPLTEGMTMANTDVFRITVGTANGIAITLFGSEQS